MQHTSCGKLYCERFHVSLTLKHIGSLDTRMLKNSMRHRGNKLLLCGFTPDELSLPRLLLPRGVSRSHRCISVSHQERRKTWLLKDLLSNSTWECFPLVEGAQPSPAVLPESPTPAVRKSCDSWSAWLCAGIPHHCISLPFEGALQGSPAGPS